MKRLGFGAALLAVLCVGVHAAGSPTGQGTLRDQQLADAKALSDRGNLGDAVKAMDKFIAENEPAAKDPAVAKQVQYAYELRARWRSTLGLRDAADADFHALIRLAPAYVLTPPVPTRVSIRFEEIRKTLVGKIMLDVTPVDAELLLDDAPFTPAAGPIQLLVGAHKLTGTKPGHRMQTTEFQVGSGSTTDVKLELERVAASVKVATSPVGVEIMLDNVSKGVTEAGVIPPEWAELVAKLGAPAGTVSKPFLLDSVTLGPHKIEYRLKCHTNLSHSFEITALTDQRLDPVKLEKAVGSISVEANVPGISVFFDGEPRGQAPAVFDDVCEGPHKVELKAAWGMYSETVTVAAGEKYTVKGNPRPAVALLSVTGLPDGYRGTDQRQALVQGLAAAKTLIVTAPPPEKVKEVLKAESLQEGGGWLAFDQWRRPIGSVASAIEKDARREIGAKLAKNLGVQGLGELTLRPGADLKQFFLSILAADSGEPDVIPITIDDLASLQKALARLDEVPAMYRPSAGLTVADVHDVVGAVVVSADTTATRAGLAPGYVITKAGGEPVKDGTSFNDLVAKRKASDKLSIEARDPAGAVKTAQLAITMAPRLIAMKDQSLLFNNLALALQARISQAGAKADSVERLNLAVALMRLGDWRDAAAELKKVSLPAGAGVSNGTVQYLLGLCYEALLQLDEALQAWRQAEIDSECMLTEEGPLIKELVAQKLQPRR